MVAGCGNKCVKYTFFTFNLLFFICGGVILGLALYGRFGNNVQISSSDQSSAKAQETLDQMYIGLYVMMAIGALLCLTGFLGCCGACCENLCLLGLFFTIVIILFLAEIAAAIYVFIKKDTFKTEITNAIQNMKGQEALKPLEQAFNCCGTDGTDGVSSDCKSGQITKSGCIDAIWDKIKKNIVAVAAVALAVLVIELLAMIFTCILCRAVRTVGYDYA